MMRRYPVRSVLSERKMFSNGGMLPTSKPVESSMNQASGIMASSSPLIDAVSQEILAPMTGGAMPMAQGGVARFRNGGSSSELFRETRIKVDRLKKINALIKEGFPVDEAIRIVDGEGIPDVQVDSRAGPPRKDMNFLDPSVSVDKFNAIYGEQLPEGGPPSINVNEDLLSLIPEANRASFAEELAANERARNLNTPASSMRAAPPPTDMSFLPDFKSSAAMFDTVAQPDLPESGGSVPRNTVDPRVAERLIELGTTREIVQDPGLPESGGTPPSGLSEVDALTRQRMAELGTTMGIVQDPGLPESGATPPSTVAEAVIEAAPPPTDMSFLDPTSSVDAFDAIYGEQLPESGIQSSAMAARRAATLGAVTPEAIEAGSKTFSEAMSDNSGLKKVGEELSDVARIAGLEAQGVPADQARERVEGERAQAIAKQQQDASALSVDEQLELGEGPEAEGPTFNFSTAKPEQVEEPQAEAQPDEPELTDLEKVDQELERSERLEEALRGGDVKTDIGIGDNFTVDEAEASTKTKASTAEPGSPAADSDVAPENAAYISSPDKFAKEFANADMPEKEATKTLAAYKQEFMDEMPEYEGMSEAEKGFALMEAGLRVAAGESANAITNVAKGLKGLGAQFAKDEKEKRAWKRQVDLSAAKYALQKSSTDDANALALAKENRVFKRFIVKTPFTEGGVRYKEGSIYQPTVGDMREDNFSSILPNLTTEGIYTKYIDEKIKAADLIKRTYGPTMLGSGKGAEKGSDWEKSFTDYNVTLNDLKTSSTMVTMIDSSIAINAQGKVTGLTNLGKRAVAKLAASAGMSQELSTLKKLGEKDGIESLKFRDQQQVIANMMLREILGEGSKNVSNIDRQLAGEIVGLMTEYGSIAAVPELLNDRLQRIRTQVTNGITNNINKLRGTEVRWENYVNRSQRSLSNELSRVKSEAVPDILMPQPKASNRRSKEVSVSKRVPLLFKDFYDMKTMKQIKKIPRQ